MISGDAIIQASATIIVGVVFLVTLRQALELEATRSFLYKIVVAVAVFALASAMAFNMENPLYSEYERWEYGVWTMIVFDLGLVILIWCLYETVREKNKAKPSPAAGGQRSDML